MSFINRNVQYPGRRKLTIISQTPTEIIADIDRNEGTINQEGTSISADNLNNLMEKNYSNSSITLPVNKGGTGTTSFTASRVLMSGTSSTAAFTTKNGSSNEVILGDGTTKSFDTVVSGSTGLVTSGNIYTYIENRNTIAKEISKSIYTFGNSSSPVNVAISDLSNKTVLLAFEASRGGDGAYFGFIVPKLANGIVYNCFLNFFESPTVQAYASVIFYSNTLELRGTPYTQNDGATLRLKGIYTL